MLYFQTVTPALLKIITAVSAEPFFQHFRLVGGTSLSLQLGHRMSVDADFFTNEDFDKEEAAALLARLLPGFLLLKKSAHGFAGAFEGVKLDIYTWGAPFLLPTVEIGGIRMADLRDVTALKLEAITNRKEEKDFRDVHALLQRFSLAELITFFKERYPHHNPKMLIDHLLAAPFVERDLTIPLFVEVSWEKLGADIVQAVGDFYEQKKKEREQQEEERLRLRFEEIRKTK
ncbi:MAG: nucleotidyl transferase AbiEii/AbiGii toxin family protein [Bacteroidota bacterium]